MSVGQSAICCQLRVSGWTVTSTSNSIVHYSFLPHSCVHEEKEENEKDSQRPRWRCMLHARFLRDFCFILAAWV